ncbi:bifunctional proline dehydrogenase/L-glutamate gamma-semialdehyde dehydrogenase [Ilumatobacter sp.]|uniref:bifunctional proline dehydrogenase/L-glutamate gamma-semialdehyde dehydrogenase n=1 Tax=Ilumatobacter sp. TaxID=1967498 RepID=UPI003B5227F1
MSTAAVAPAPDTSDDELVERATELARRLLATSRDDESRDERRRRERLGALLADSDGRQLIFALTDEVLRIDDPDLAARRFAAVVAEHPSGAMGPLDSLALRAGAVAAPRLARLVMPLVARRIKDETRGIVIPASDPRFSRHLARRSSDGVRINVNPLGEAILSDAEAAERTEAVRSRIARDDVDYVSVKVSAVVANLDPYALEHSLDRVAGRLREIYRSARAARVPVFVNLDMEEYGDLELTERAFTRVLDTDEFAGLDAGIVLQAYLPDSHAALERLGDWANRRHGRTGGTIKVRLVKGANLAMERVEAELHGWTAAPYATKADVDASYKAMLDSALRPEWAGALRIGLASHNLFDVAWALTVADRRGALDRVEFEMLEGMAPAQARAVHAVAGDLLMYAPVVSDEDFDASIAYLTRRLDENTQPENFLRSLFTLRPDSVEFDAEAQRFALAVAERHHASHARRRGPRTVDVRDGFENEPDSDLTDPAVRAAFRDAVERPPTPEFEPVADAAGVDAVMERARGAFERGDHSPAERRRWLLDVAELMSAERAATIGLMAATAVKTVHEGDPEVSEAIDFCRYDATGGSDRLVEARRAGLDVAGRGVNVVVGPWNFPYAIPTGGVAASIAAGDSVVLKPAPEVTEVGAWIADQFWRAGVPRDVLQLVVCDDGPVGRHLVTHPDVDTVVLTGAHATASMFLDWRPDLRVLAETSGKDALVITPAADIDQAIADLVRSAFGHAGQKCSAASLGIVVAEVHDDPTFRRRLRDAVTSLRVGPATDPATMVGPLVGPPGDDLRRALTTLEPGESWLVEPTRLEPAAHAAPDPAELWAPGVRLGVEPGSWFHRTECFGPVLGLIRADDLDHAIRIQNASDFGLTGGIHSLDDAEVAEWLRRVEVGNAYVNRHITGAVVRRQPFGGWKRSSVGGGAKAGGPGYVAQFARITEPGPLDDVDVEVTTARFRSQWQSWWCADHDPSGLEAESNVLRYRALGCVAVRHDGASADGGDGDRGPLAIARIAARVTGVELVESTSARESDVEFAHRAARRADTGRPVDRVRLLGDLDDAARSILHAAGVAVDDSPPVRLPAIELQRWVREQAISRTLHRHGRLVVPGTGRRDRPD